jgi:hypothetical protein
MADITLEQEILDQVHGLSSEQQRQVLDFARSLRRPQGIPGKELLRFVGMISPDDLEMMKQAIEEECEQIDPDEWDDKSPFDA